MRIGCLHVPDLPLASLVRAEPRLAEEAVAVVEPGSSSYASASGSGPSYSHEVLRLRSDLGVAKPAPPRLLGGNLRILACTPRAAPITQGMTLAAAQAIRPDLRALPASAERTRAAAQAALEAAGSISPRIEEAAPGLVFLDLEGLGHLHASEHALAQALGAAAVKVGLRAAVGVAEGKTAARLAAHAAAADLDEARWFSSAVCVVPEADLRAFLAELPLAALDPPPELLDALHRFGLVTVGDAARLPAGAAAARLGAEGAALLRVARGEDRGHLVARPAPERFEEGEELEWDAAAIEPLLFVWKSLLDRLARRLSERGLAAAEVWLLLRLSGGAWDERSIALAAPTREVAPLLSLLRLEVERRPPGEAVRAVRIAVRPAPARLDQLALFAARTASPAEVAAAVARIAALVGPESVGRPVAPDTHRPLAAAVEPFAPPAAPLIPEAAEVQPALAVRALRPPRAAEVRCDAQGRPAVVSDGARLGGRVVSSAGPWRTVAEWWTPQPVALDTFDLEVAGGTLLRASRELQSGAWWIEAVYD